MQREAQHVERIIARPRCRGGKEGRSLAAKLFVAGEVRKEGRRAPCSFSHLVFNVRPTLPPPSPTFLRGLGVLQKARVALLFLQKLLSALKYPPPRTARGSTPTELAKEGEVAWLLLPVERSRMRASGMV